MSYPNIQILASLHEQKNKNNGFCTGKRKMIRNVTVMVKVDIPRLIQPKENFYMQLHIQTTVVM